MAVPHWCGVTQLPFCGINGNKFSWFENYLFNRKQHVLYNGHLSEAFSVFRGVPQRSILSPTLFYLIWMILITVYTILVKYSLNLKKDKVETMIFGTSICVKKAAPLNIQIKGTSINQTSYKYLGTHLTQHWHWMVTSTQNTESSVPDYNCCQNYAQIWM